MKKRVTLLTISLSFLLIWALSAQQIDIEQFKDIDIRNIGPAGMSGRVTAIDAVVDNPNIIYIGTASGGVWKSENGGLSWVPIFEKEQVQAIGSLAINQNNPSEIWVGTGEGNPRNSLSSGYGIYHSLDAGHSWTYKGLGDTRHIHRIIIHPDNPSVIFAGVIGSPWGEQVERGVYKSTDGGSNWKKVLYVDEKTGCADLVIDPTNPNKLVAAMWEHRRWPWFFNSGGPGSGLYISHDGGESWEKRTAEDGLPTGDLGRIGLAIAPSNPNIIYALVESKKNGLYKSTDGGFTFKLVSTKNIGNRPFYYADLYVDPQNENRLVNIYTYVDISQDGGKTFERLIPSQFIHVDNHAFWIHPNDPKLMMCGNDGGFCLSRDGGKTWAATENLPLGQFYHIRVDNEIPYNVSGGMQDNGSWRGPSQVWRRKGIRNLYWNRVGYGDGFDVLPDPKSERFGYSLSQGGNLLRYDLHTGSLMSIKPYLKSGEALRFNWNAALAIDPFDQTTLYMGSQFVLKSDDRGQSWSKISSDLTTNDPQKQQQIKTGGLSLDNSGAENHTTILVIEPSEVEQGLMWVGTDDGNIQLTRDGGGQWTKVNEKIRGLPQHAWIAQIKPSTHNAGEAFVVVNNYRQNDWKPYLFHTTDYGNSWKNLTSSDNIWGHCLSIVQDPITPNLLFLGTEYGLYVSIDKGTNWNKWTHFPSVPTRDMVIHPREHDLVIGTFGRAAWIMDDIRPLRTLAQEGYQKIVDSDLTLFPIPHAYLANLGEPNGYRSTGNGIFMGENRQQGALISFYLKSTKDKKTQAVLKVMDESGNQLRQLKFKVKEGLNRVNWGLEKSGIRFPGGKRPKADASEPRGRSLVPGKYQIELSYDGLVQKGSIEIIADPHIPTSQSDMVSKAALIDDYQSAVGKVTEQVYQLQEAKETSNWLIKKMQTQDEENFKDMIASAKSINEGIDEIMESIRGPQDVQGLYRDPNLLSSKLRGASRALQDVIYPVIPSQKYQVEHAKKAIAEISERIDQFMKEKWISFRTKVEESDLSMF